MDLRINPNLRGYAWCPVIWAAPLQGLYGEFVQKEMKDTAPIGGSYHYSQIEGKNDSATSLAMGLSNFHHPSWLWFSPAPNQFTAVLGTSKYTPIVR